MDTALAAEQAVVTPTPIDRAALATKLGLSADADDAAIWGKIDELLGLSTQAATANSTLTNVQAELDKVRAEFDALYQKQTELEKQKREAEVDTILEQFADRLTDQKAKDRIRTLLLTDRESAMDILQGLPVVNAAADAGSGGASAAGGTPPDAMHDPNADAANSAMTAEEKAKEAEALIAAIRKEGKFKDYTSAREEARRRKPELFA